MSENQAGATRLKDLAASLGAWLDKTTPAGRRRRRLLRTIAIVLVLLFALATCGYQALAGKIHTFSGAGLASHRPADSNGQNILLIGTDSRSGSNASLGGGGDAVGRSDTTILVHVYPHATSAVAVSIPRDTLVTIPSCRMPDGSWTKPQPDTMFNAAFTVGQTTTGNPACTVNTVEKLTGLRIDHTAVVNFAGFAAMSKAVGGVPVCLPNDVYQGDINPNQHTRGPLVFHAGTQTVEGAKALDYVRLRHGIGDGSDIGRMKRQQAFLSSLVMTIRKQGLSPDHIWPLVNAATKNVTFDPSLSSPASLFSFAMGLRHINPHHIDFLTMPWTYDGPRVAIDQPAANDLWTALRTDQPLTGKTKPQHAPSASASPHHAGPPKGSGPVQVLNGTWTSGLAGSTAGRLTTAGFHATAGNAPFRNYRSTQIHYRPADKAKAQLLARYLQAKLVPDPKATTPTVYLGTSHKWLGPHSASATDSGGKLPSTITGALRNATSNPCSGTNQ